MNDVAATKGLCIPRTSNPGPFPKPLLPASPSLLYQKLLVPMAFRRSSFCGARAVLSCHSSFSGANPCYCVGLSLDCLASLACSIRFGVDIPMCLFAQSRSFEASRGERRVWPCALR